MKWTLDVKNWGKFAIFRYPSQPFRTKWTLDGDFEVSATTLSDEMDVGRQKLTAKPDGAYRFSGLRAPGWRCWTRRLWWSHGSARGQPHGPHGADPWAASFPTVGCRGPRISLRLPGPAVTVQFQTSSLMGSQQPFSSDVLPLLMAGSGRRICIYIYMYLFTHTHACLWHVHTFPCVQIWMDGRMPELHLRKPTSFSQTLVAGLWTCWNFAVGPGLDPVYKTGGGKGGTTSKMVGAEVPLQIFDVFDVCGPIVWPTVWALLAVPKEAFGALKPFVQCFFTQHRGANLTSFDETKRPNWRNAGTFQHMENLQN